MARWLTTLGLVCLASCVHDWDRLGTGEGSGGGGGTTTTSTSSGYTPTTFCIHLCQQREERCTVSDITCQSSCPGFIEDCQFPDDDAALENCIELAYTGCTQALLADGSFSTCAADACQ